MGEPTISTHEAKEALNLIEATTKQMRYELAVGGMPFYLFIWGVIWMVGFGAAHFLGPDSSLTGTVWMVLDGAGVVASFLVGAHLGTRLRWRSYNTMGLFWLSWLGYGALIIYFAAPQSGSHLSLLISLFAMFGYVITGLFYRSTVLVALGIGITVFLLIGYVFLPTYFNLWMAILGGGGLIGAGAYIRWVWR